MHYRLRACANNGWCGLRLAKKRRGEEHSPLSNGEGGRVVCESYDLSLVVTLSLMLLAGLLPFQFDP